MWVFLFSAFAAAAPPSTVLRFEQGLTRYAVEKTKKELVMYGSPATLRIPIQPCNREVVDNLWKHIETRIKFLPKLHKREIAIANETVELGGKKRALVNFNPLQIKATRFFRTMPTEFLFAQMTSQRRCKR